MAVHLTTKNGIALTIKASSGYVGRRVDTDALLMALLAHVPTHEFIEQPVRDQSPPSQPTKVRS